MNGRRIRTLFAVLFGAVALSGICMAEDASRPSAVEARAAYDSGAVFVDVRTDAEWSAGHLKNARHLPVDEVAADASTVLPQKNEPVVVVLQVPDAARRARPSNSVSWGIST